MQVLYDTMPEHINNLTKSPILESVISIQFRKSEITQYPEGESEINNLQS